MDPETHNLVVYHGDVSKQPYWLSPFFDNLSYCHFLGASPSIIQAVLQGICSEIGLTGTCPSVTNGLPVRYSTIYALRNPYLPMIRTLVSSTRDTFVINDNGSNVVPVRTSLSQPKQSIVTKSEKGCSG